MSLGGFFAEMVQSGALLVAMPLAVVAGLVSFLSPCILPLVPGYLGYVSGLADPRRADNRRRVMTGVGLFIMGFAAVFTLYGAAFGVIGGWLLQWQDALIRALGVFVILMGLVLIGWLPFLQNTRRMSFQPRTGIAGAPLLARYTGNRAGHAMTNRLLRTLFATPDAWEWVTCSTDCVQRLPGAGVVRPRVAPAKRDAARAVMVA